MDIRGFIRGKIDFRDHIIAPAIRTPSNLGNNVQ